MAERLNCQLCGKEFENKHERFVHIERWGCPVARREYDKLFAPFCACGCGHRVGRNKRNPQRFNKFIQGHNTK